MSRSDTRLRQAAAERSVRLAAYETEQAELARAARDEGLAAGPFSPGSRPAPSGPVLPVHDGPGPGTDSGTGAGPAV